MFLKHVILTRVIRIGHSTEPAFLKEIEGIWWDIRQIVFVTTNNALVAQLLRRI